MFERLTNSLTTRVHTVEVAMFTGSFVKLVKHACDGSQVVQAAVQNFELNKWMSANKQDKNIIATT